MNIEVKDLDNYTPLMTAVAYGSEKITQALLDENAQINVYDAHEKSIIYIAVENDQEECLEVCIISINIYHEQENHNTIAMTFII